MKKKGIIYKYEKQFLTYDLIISIIILGIVLVLIYINNNFILNFINNISNAYDLILSMSVTMLGFIITGVSILVVFLERESLALFHKSKNYSLIYQIYFSAIKYLALLTIFTLLAYGLKPFGQTILNYIIILCCVISIFRIYRCVWVLKKIIDVFIGEKIKNSS